MISDLISSYTIGYKGSVVLTKKIRYTNHWIIIQTINYTKRYKTISYSQLIYNKQFGKNIHEPKMGS